VKVMVERPNWGAPAAGSGLGGRETPGHVVVEKPSLTPVAATTDAGIGDEVDAEEARTNAEMLRTGAFTREERARHRGQSVEALSLPGSRRASIAKEIAEIEAIMRTDRRRYDREFAQRYGELLQAREQLGAAPTSEVVPDTDKEQERGEDSAMPQEVLDSWRAAGGIEHHTNVAIETANVALAALESDEERAGFVESFDAKLPESVVAAVYQNIGSSPGFTKPATDDAVAEFAGLSDAHAELVKGWGGRASRLVGVAQARVSSILRGLSVSDRQTAVDWLDSLPAAQQVAVMKALAGGR
jgi:hypothetical protein